MSRKKVQHVGKILFSILSVLLGFLGILLFTSSRWMLATWAHLDMEELVYHLKAPLEGTSKDVLWSYVWSCGMISFAVLAILIALFIILRHRKKVEMIMQAETKGEITEILKLSKPHFDGNKFVYTSPYAVEEEELLLWSLTSLQGPLRDEGYQR